MEFNSSENSKINILNGSVTLKNLYLKYFQQIFRDEGAYKEQKSAPLSAPSSAKICGRLD
jgi:hypothetical protein